MIIGTVKCVCIILCVSETVKCVTVNTENGALSGTQFRTYRGRVVNAFLGIPYAKPPVKELRLRDPQPADKWEGVQSAETYGSPCVQYTYYRDLPLPVEGDEDCLFLNIYTPSVSNTSKLNVIVFIHGGCFMVGDGGSYTPYYIMDHSDIVFITLNYRVGPLGFLSTEDNIIPGNYGLKDQVLALKWIRDNVDQFGGDKNKVTITGNSAGGVSVHLHYMSPLSRDLFRNGISESGTAFCPWALTESPLQKAKILSAAVGCPTDKSEDILKCLQLKDANSLIVPIKPLFLPWVYNPFSPFGPVVEPESATAFLSRDPYTIVSEGSFKDVPWMTYMTTEEGLYPASTFIANNTLLRELDEHWIDIAPHLLDYNYTVAQDELKNVSEQIRKFYFGDEKINIENRDSVVKLMSDRIFGVSAEKTVRLQASVAKSPVYFYVFGYRGSLTVAKAFCNCNEYFGVSHVDSTLYLLKTGLISSDFETENDIRTAETMANIWTSFANSSVPFASNNFFIPPVSPVIGAEGNLTYFLLTSTNKIESTADLTNRKFWNSLPIMENEKANYSFVASNSYSVQQTIKMCSIVFMMFWLLFTYVYCN